MKNQDMLLTPLLGQGIIVYGEDKVAFRNQISKDFYIYQINQTSNMQLNRS